MPGRLPISESRLLGRDDRVGARELRAIIPVIELYEHVSRLDELVVSDGYSVDEACDLGGNGRHLATNVGVVGPLNETTDGPPVPAVPHGRSSESKRRYTDGKAFAQAPQRLSNRLAILIGQMNRRVHCVAFPEGSIYTYCVIVRF
jgi:hypothetical protein